MNRTLVFVLLTVSFCCCKGNGQVDSVQNDGIANNSVVENGTMVDSLPSGVRRLLCAYPDQVREYRNGFLIMTKGDSVEYDDGIQKDFITMLDNSDPEDMFATPYRKELARPQYLSDAGRSRCERLFKSMYGSSEAEVRSNLVTIDWFGQRILFSKINGCADSLRKVAEDLIKHEELLPYMRQSSSFYWRSVRGAKRQSAHSYGIAIDICTAYSNYWLWSNPKASESDHIEYVNRIPMQIVDIFERHGFIWGGRWYHYDTMHFEFRPELMN